MHNESCMKRLQIRGEEVGPLSRLTSISQQERKDERMRKRGRGGGGFQSLPHDGAEIFSPSLKPFRSWTAIRASSAAANEDVKGATVQPGRTSSRSSSCVPPSIAHFSFNSAVIERPIYKLFPLSEAYSMF